MVMFYLNLTLNGCVKCFTLKDSYEQVWIPF